MTQAERRTVGALASVYLIRMLGLFLLLPVLAIYASRCPAASPTLIGLALGVYGLTQAALQIPFGRWSDRWGRKPVIAIGLVLFVAGSVLGAARRFVAEHRGGAADSRVRLAPLVGYPHITGIVFGVVNFLEDELPALLSRAAPTGDRGAALGVFATGQFTGTFAGGAAGGVLMHLYGVPGVFMGALAMALYPRTELTGMHTPGHELEAAPADDAGGS